MAIIIFIVIGAVAIAGAMWFVFRGRRLTRGKGAGELSFRWRYIIFPLAILLLSIILSASFYHRLSAEVAYHFSFSYELNIFLNNIWRAACKSL